MKSNLQYSCVLEQVVTTGKLFLPGTRAEASLDTVPNISYKGEMYLLT